MEAGQDGRVDLAPWIYKVVGPEGALEVTEVGRDALAEEEKGLLAGDFSVDFEQEPLASTGLFAISGPTGAGKSTLLDALCLALYDDTPQLDLFAAPTVDANDDAVAAPAAAVESAAMRALLDALDDLDPDALTPREALDQLYQLKRLTETAQA